MPPSMRSAMLAVVFASLLGGCHPTGTRVDSEAPPLGADVPLHRVFERRIVNAQEYSNKFIDVTLQVEYTAPSGKKIRFAGFYDGDGAGGQNGAVWKIRFMPHELGTWRYQYSWSDGSAGGGGAFRAVAAGAGRGVLRPYQANPRWFAYNGTEPVLLKSYHVGSAGFTGVPIDWAVTNVYTKLAARGFNHVMLKALPIGWTDGKPPDAPADHVSRPLWRETPQVQDLEVWRRFEQHIAWLNDHDMHVFFFMGFDPKPGSSASSFFALKRWSDMSGPEQDFYVRYVAARLAPFANIAGWNYTWETDGTGGERRLMELLDRYDPWSHLKTYHDETPAENAYDNPQYTFAGIENHGYFNRADAPALDSASHHQATIDAYRQKPVYMVEGNGLWRVCWAKEGADPSITRAAWAVMLAGGSFTWQDTGTNSGCSNGPTSDMFTWPAGIPMVERVAALYTVMTRDVTFHTMTPRNDLLSGCWSTFDRNGPVPRSPCFALAQAGKQYVVYKEDGGNFTLDVASGSYRTTWLDTRTGVRRHAGGRIKSRGRPLEFTAPSTTTDWVLVLKAES